MRSYTINKILSFAAVFLCIVGTYVWHGFTTYQWQAILYCIVIFGHAHFFIGFYYQLRSFARSELPVARYVSFVVLTLLSIGIAYLIFSVFGFITGLFLGFVYFLFHGLLNERTLIERQTGISVPLSPLTALAIFIIALLTYTVPDRTFFFDHTLQFHSVSEAFVSNFFISNYVQLSYFPSVFWAGLFIACFVLVVAWYRYSFPRLVLTVASFIGVLTAGTVIFGAPPYIYMYLFVVGYHFMTWLIFYLEEFKRRGAEPWRGFVGINVAVFLVLVVLALCNEQQPSALTSFVFDYRVFVVLTYIHISTSFMNDAWFKNLESHVARHFFNR